MIYQKLSSQGRRFGYARVSTMDQSLAAQQLALREADCERIFEDHGQSGTKTQRPALDQLLRELKAHDTLVVWRLSRLGRSVRHLADLLEELRQAQIGFLSLTEGIDTNTPGGRMIFHVLAATSQLERDTISDNTVAGMRAAKERGVHVGRPRLITDTLVESAFKLTTVDCLTQKEAATELGVSTSTVRRAIQARETD